MIITVEISHYPLTDIYEGPIIDLIKKMKSMEELEMYTNAMSTYIQGEYDSVMSSIMSTLKEVYADDIPSSTVLKIIPRKLPIDRGWMQF